ncbi:2-amino-4-hydroxy-6-hydroxymethyldihydropteridine diphosphokinase [Sphaerotilus montanus]|uniref:2-amino-4-hydroxy-6- hydroxymethyldihydropteridine diphosphokinase n=1 Tax=Sphaerotilus montanus TaxID=522889 RepID=UPI003FA2DB3D
MTRPRPDAPALLACIGLGANLGDAAATLDAACAALAVLPATGWVAVSGRWPSRPVEARGPDYLNAVACVRTRLTPEALLDALQAIELAHGRERPYPNAPRTLDLDLLLHGDLQRHTVRLTLPHPRLTERAFVLLPLLQLCAALPGQLVLPAGMDASDWPARAQRLAAEQGIAPA